MERTWQDDWDVFTEETEGRMHQGERDYGNKTLSLNPSRLLWEFKEELQDAVAYLFFIWRRIDAVDHQQLDMELGIQEIADMVSKPLPADEGIPVDQVIELRDMLREGLITRQAYDRLIENLLEQ